MNYNGEPGSAFPKAISYSRVVELSQTIHPNIPRWPSDPRVVFDTVTQTSNEHYRLRRISLGEHNGTHINTPSSFHDYRMSIGGFIARSLIAPAVVMDAAERSARNADYLVTLEDIQVSEQQFGSVTEGSIVLLYSGWQEKWDTAHAFLNLDSNGAGHFPGFGIEAVRFLLSERRVGDIRIDTHDVDCGQHQKFAVTRLILEKPRIGLENLTNLDQLPPTSATQAIGILRLTGGTGSPASVLALVL